MNIRGLVFALVSIAVGCVAQVGPPSTTNSWHIEFSPEAEAMLDTAAVIEELNVIWLPIGVSFDTFEGEETRTVHVTWGDPEAHVLGECAPGKDCVTQLAPLQRYPEERWAQLAAAIISHEMGHSYGLGHTEDQPWAELPINGCDIMYSEFWGICTVHEFAPEEIEQLQAQVAK
jgi:hypothetical protein